jgi:hypothetical protein
MNPNRVWFYFRHGYAYYIASILAPFNTIMLLVGFSDKLGISQDILTILIPIIIVVGVPSIVFLGRTHYKKAYSSEVDVVSLHNQYNYKFLPKSKESEILYPAILEILKDLQERKPNKKIEKIEDNIIRLLKGEKI